MLEIISYASSIATLMLFVIYFIGRVWVIHKNKRLLFEKFALEYIGDDHIERKNQYDLGGKELITVSSSQGLNWLKIYELKFDSVCGEMTVLNKQPVVTHKILNVDEKLYLKTNTPCGIPIYRVRYQRFDYIEGSFDIGVDGKYGGLGMRDYKSKLTLKSYCYYICK
ncbi:hypothetical protein [Clostridium sp.]|uniref:hypothetical protein n=1 Tax=Clostridium sp. TaxID=1506 RepID=UPI00321801BD